MFSCQTWGEASVGSSLPVQAGRLLPLRLCPGRARHGVGIGRPNDCLGAPSQLLLPLALSLARRRQRRQLWYGQPCAPVSLPLLLLRPICPVAARPPAPLARPKVLPMPELPPMSTTTTTPDEAARAAVGP